MNKKVDKMQFIIILSQIEEKIRENSLLAANDKERLLLKIAALCSKYTYLNVSDKKDHKTLFLSLLLQGEKLLKEYNGSRNTREITNKTARYFRYLEASIYDFKGDLAGLNWYARCFTVTAALFMALTPQFFGFVLPVLFLIPIFGGLRGIRKRSLTAMNMTLTVVPMAIMTSITWIRYLLQAALPDFSRAVAATSQTWNVSPKAAQFLIIVPGLLSMILAAAALMTAYYGYKYRSMFV